VPGGHKWSNPKLTLNDYRAILSCHVTQFSCFNWMVGKQIIWKNIFKNSNDAMCHIVRLLHVNILMCTIVANVIASVVTRTHPWISVKFPYFYSTKKYFICRLRLSVVYNLSFATMLIFNCCIACN
jgi:hypothetical protein